MAWTPDLVVVDTVISTVWGTDVRNALEDLRQHDHSTGADGNGAVLPSDAVAGTASLRSLGSGAQQGAAGTHIHPVVDANASASVDPGRAVQTLALLSTSYGRQQRITQTPGAAGRAIVIFAPRAFGPDSNAGTDLGTCTTRILVDSVQQVTATSASLGTSGTFDLDLVCPVHVAGNQSASSHNYDSECKKDQAGSTNDWGVFGGPSDPEAEQLYVEELRVNGSL